MTDFNRLVPTILIAVIVGNATMVAPAAARDILDAPGMPTIASPRAVAGNTIVLSGVGLTSQTQVSVGGVPVPVSKLTATSLEITVPQLATGTHHVVVEGKGGSLSIAVRPPSGIVSERVVQKPDARSQQTVQVAATASIHDPGLLACIDDALDLPQGTTPSQAQMASITSLACQDRDISSLSGLEAARSLRSLDVSRNRLTSLDPLAALGGLQRLWVSDNDLIRIDPLAALADLRELDVSSNGLRDLGPLSRNVNLFELSADDNDIVSLAPLRGLEHLNTLRATHNAVLDLSPLADLPLEDLQLWHNQIHDIAPLANLGGLKRLDLADNSISASADLRYLPRLTELNLEGNQLRELGGLAGLRELRAVNAGRNHVSSVAPLAKATNLYWLHLDQNHILDLSPLGGLPIHAISAEAQDVTLPVAFSRDIVLALRDRTGAVPDLQGAAIQPGGLRWPAAGSQTAVFVNQDGTFSGQIHQAVRPQERLGDANDDGFADMHSLDAGRLEHWSGRAMGLGERRTASRDWANSTVLAKVHDLTGDRLSDLVIRDAAGTLWAHPVTGVGSVGSARQLGRNWNGMPIVAPAGHLTGTSSQFIVARRSDGALFRYLVTPNGLSGISQVGWGWGAMRHIAGMLDWNGDSREDILAVRDDGTLWLYRATPRGTFASGIQVGHGWSGFRSVKIVGDLTGDGYPDLVGLRSDGVLYLYPRLPGRWGPAVQVAEGWNNRRLIC